MFEEYSQGQNSGSQERNLVERAAQAAGKEGLDANLHSGSQSVQVAAYLCLKTV